MNAFLLIASAIASPAQLETQYDPIASKYSNIFVENNQDSITAYYRHFQFPMEGLKVLDLGCGDGYDLSNMRKKGADIYGIDTSKEMVQLAQQKNPDGTIQLASFKKIPYGDQTFDLIISKWAFQTSDMILPIYKEIARVLKKNGKLIFLSSHPMRQFIERKKKGKNYFIQEIVESFIFEGKVRLEEPSHTMNEYLSPFFFQSFQLLSFEEGFDSGAEKVDGDIYPSYFIIEAVRN